VLLGAAFVSLAFASFWRALATAAPAIRDVSVYVDGFTNYYGGPRMAVVVVTNQSSAPFRIWAVVGLWGRPPSGPVRGARSLNQESWLLAGHSGIRVPILTPTNGVPWCGVITLSRDARLYRTADTLLRFGLLRGFVNSLLPQLPTEDVFTATSGQRQSLVATDDN